MADFFVQLSVVGALLGGFAFTFVGALLTHPGEHRVYPFVFGCSLASAMSFVLTAVAAVLASLAVRNSFPVDIRFLQEAVSIAFLAGISAFLLAMASCGWLKGRSLGWVSTSIATLSAVALVAVLSPFVRVA